MKRNPDHNAPLVEASARGLGVRPTDLTPCELGLAHSRRGGMSVAPSMTDIQPWRIPARLGHLVEGATGPDSDHVWVLGQADFVDAAVAPGLVLRTTSDSHGVVEPDECRPFHEYVADLAATADEWKVFA